MSISNNKRLSEKVAIVTGSGGGIGRHEALLLARQGARVVVNDIAKDSDGKLLSDKVVEEITHAGAEAVSAPYSVATMDGARQIVQAAIDRFGRLDILVNNAGMKGANPVEKMSENQWDRIVDSHLKAAFALSRFSIPHLRHQGEGIIVNIGSESGLGHAFNGAYSAAKEGMVGLTRTLARELGRFNIRCNLIRPRAGAVSGPTMKAYAVWQPVMKSLGRFSLGNRGHVREVTYPEQVAPLVVWLCTDKARNVNGRSFYVSGDHVGLWSEPELMRTVTHKGGWDLDSLDEYAGDALTFDLDNDFLIENPFEDDPYQEELL